MFTDLFYIRSIKISKSVDFSLTFTIWDSSKSKGYIGPNKHSDIRKDEFGQVYFDIT